VRVEFHRAEDEGSATVATAVWDGRDVTIDASDADVLAGLARAFRRTPVVTDDAAYRRLGTSGDVAIPPGELAWFRAVAHTRVLEETGLRARFVPGAPLGGFDPAAGYRGFEEQLERLDARSRG